MTSHHVVTVTAEQLRAQWNALFDAHPWLDGLTGSCDDATCCPDNHPDLDWTVLSRVSGVLFLATGTTAPRVLTRDLLP